MNRKEKYFSQKKSKGCVDCDIAHLQYKKYYESIGQYYIGYDDRTKHLCQSALEDERITKQTNRN